MNQNAAKADSPVLTEQRIDAKEADPVVAVVGAVVVAEGVSAVALVDPAALVDPLALTFVAGGV